MKHLYKITCLIFLMVINPAQAQETGQVAPQDIVSAVFPYPIEATRGLILQEFSSDDRSYYEDYNGAIFVLPHEAKTIRDLSEKEYKRFIDFPLVRPTKFYVFYGAYPNMQARLQQITPESTALDNNPALQRYAELPQEERENDIYLWSPDAPYWYSDGIDGDKSLPFHSYFILHLHAEDSKNTSVEIIEDQPTAKFGKKFSVDSHGVVHNYDIRPVASTLRDREFLLSCVGQFLKYDYPDRKKFICKG